MAVTLNSADNALKTVYLDAVSEQLNDYVNPFFSAIEKNSNDVWGKEIKKLVTFGVNGGIGAGDEDGALPKIAGNTYTQFTSTLKNLYGVIEISDKALRASQTNAGAFVNLLNAEMDGLVKASKLNFSRMLFGTGIGALAEVLDVYDNEIQLDNFANVFVGMVVDFRDRTGEIIEGFEGRKITYVDPVNFTCIRVDGDPIENSSLEPGTIITLQNSINKELTGLGAIFATEMPLYGNDRRTNGVVMPAVVNSVGEITEDKIQLMIDDIELKSGTKPNMIICSYGVRRVLQKIFSENKTLVGTMELAGGFTAMSYNGIPIVADRFCPKGNMYFLNTDDFTLCQLCDWQWLTDDDGKVLKQVPGKPVYTATLVKYADLLCSRPYAQGLMTDITEN